MHVFRISIGNRMNTSAFRDLWARVMFWKFSKLHEQFENFQNITSDHKSRNARAGSYDFLFIIFSTKLLLSSFSCSYSSIFGFTFHWVAHVCQTFDQVCVAFNVFLFFAFSFSFSTMFWFDKANRLSAIFL